MFYSKYIWTRKNCKLKNKFFGQFYVLYLMGKQTQKVELLKK